MPYLRLSCTAGDVLSSVVANCQCHPDLDPVPLHVFQDHACIAMAMLRIVCEADPSRCWDVHAADVQAEWQSQLVTDLIQLEAGPGLTQIMVPSNFTADIVGIWMERQRCSSLEQLLIMLEVRTHACSEPQKLRNDA